MSDPTNTPPPSGGAEPNGPASAAGDSSASSPAANSASASKSGESASAAGGSKSERDRMQEIAKEHAAHGHSKLGEWPATAICGNDITSSCLYVSALSILAAGALAPLSLLIVAVVLYLFRGVYAEAVGALPMNGGAYNTLLNTTSKFRATIAAALTILSYMATAVISSIEAIHYLLLLIPGLHHSGEAGHEPPAWELLLQGMFGEEGVAVGITIVLLTLFAGLTILGIKESSRVAMVIFFTHMAMLTILAICAGVYLFQNGFGTLIENWRMPFPNGADFKTALYFGFAAAMLGISGFESSANFVEEQKQGVFPKTLRNMWVAVSVFNPLMAVLALSLIPIADVGPNKEALLAHMGGIAAGGWLATFVSVAAVMVLSGAVLTSFIGVNGLVYRMTLDRCLPQALLKKNKNDAPYMITLCFLVAGISVLIITGGHVEALAGVYTISFLLVMALFALGNMLLKISRNRMPRPSRATWPAVIIAMLAAFAGAIGNVIRHPDYFLIFLYYFVPTMLIIIIMLTRIQIMYAVLFVVRTITDWVRERAGMVDSALNREIDRITSQTVVFFTRGDNIANLNKAMLYIRANEHTDHVKVAIVVRSADEVPDRLRDDLRLLDEEYPELKIEFEVVEGRFGPPLLQDLSARWSVPLNFMFVGTPGTGFPHGLADLGGVRVII